MRREINWLLVTVMLTAMAACAQPGDAGSGSPVDPTATPVPTNQQQLNEVADWVREQASRDFPEVYAGLEVSTGEGKVVVYRMPSRQFDAAFATRVSTGDLRMVDAAHSERELNALVQKIVADKDQWAAQKISVNSLAARHDGSCVELGTTEVEKAKNWLAQRYVGQPICAELRGPAATW